ncbi:nuclear transport factor 2 family protein [Streptomyces sp. CA-249302]|uniref:nuclear transport factor 2 family protein n=1 Tax=Streptomyces sp. CA-249302 TaxID=3240058 RepID=UPI003D8BF271
MPSTTTEPRSSAQTYVEILQFYAHQMHLLDEGAADKWALTFTESAWLDLPTEPEALHGRRAIADAALRRRIELDGSDHRQRHLPSSVTVAPGEGAAVRATCQVLVLSTPRGRRPSLAHSMTCEDVLVRGADGCWLVHDRLVVSDSTG